MEEHSGQWRMPVRFILPFFESAAGNDVPGRVTRGQAAAQTIAGKDAIVDEDDRALLRQQATGRSVERAGCPSVPGDVAVDRNTASPFKRHTRSIGGCGTN